MRVAKEPTFSRGRTTKFVKQLQILQERLTLRYLRGIPKEYAPPFMQHGLSVHEKLFLTIIDPHRARWDEDTEYYLRHVLEHSAELLEDLSLPKGEKYLSTEERETAQESIRYAMMGIMSCPAYTDQCFPTAEKYILYAFNPAELALLEGREDV